MGKPIATSGLVCARILKSSMTESLHEFDKSNLRQWICNAPEQFKVGFDLAKGIKVAGAFKRAIFYGEGGSAFPAALVDTLVRDAADRAGKDAPLIYQNHTYSLRPEASNGSLNIFCSYSGNTEETITTLNKAITAGLPSIGIASGGRLEEICEDKRVPFIKLPLPASDFQPRMGSGYFVAAMVSILANHGLSADMESEIMVETAGFLKSMDDYENKGRQLAEKIVGKTPVIWSSQKFKELARVWSIKFNEHAKNPAFWNFFPEFNHNLMVGFSNLGDRYFAIMLRDHDDDPENLRRYQIAQDVLKEHGLDSVILDLAGNNVFAKMFSSIYTADFAAYYLAAKNKMDPTPVDMVEEFKKRLDPNFGKK